MSLTILPADEIDYIVTVSDFILKFPNLSVGDIKKKFRLTTEEYDMIFELCMPRIRAGSAAAYWRTKYHMLVAKLKRILGPVEPCLLKGDILQAIDDCEASNNNELAESEIDIDYGSERIN